MQYQLGHWLQSFWVKDTRLYTLSLCQNIFGHWIVRRSWGSRIKRGYGQSNYDICPSFEAAVTLFDKEQKRREKRGYVRISSF